MQTFAPLEADRLVRLPRRSTPDRAAPVTRIAEPGAAEPQKRETGGKPADRTRGRFLDIAV
ncbi:MAG: hypothetical protein QNJ67_01695 [Kiloniellales bacterium]|nr:hypothetical protein [Kiloniellales bacterium]